MDGKLDIYQGDTSDMVTITVDGEDDYSTGWDIVGGVVAKLGDNPIGGQISGSSSLPNMKIAVIESISAQLQPKSYIFVVQITKTVEGTISLRKELHYALSVKKSGIA